TKQKHVDAQFNLALCYFYSNGIEENQTKAFEFFEKAVESGDKVVQLIVFRYLISNGRDVTDHEIQQCIIVAMLLETCNEER
ncbi:9669_t:CDS:1, partial [Diversispora eburnea]